MGFLVNKEAETGAEEEEEHQGEGAEQQSAATPFVDGEDSWEGEQEVGGTLKGERRLSAWGMSQCAAST